jgi:hypothetical protein
MKTKNFLLTGALLIVALFSVNGVMAQIPADEGTTNVHIVLNPMQAITVNQTDVTIAYTSIDDYEDGVEKTVTSHLTVHSVGPFTVRVKAESDFNYTGGGTNDAIPASHVQLTATGSTGSLGDTHLVTLDKETGTPLITSSTRGGYNMNYDVKYSTKNNNGNAFQYAKHLGGTYTAVVTYDIAQN